MRTLDEIGISPAPWEVDGNEVYCVKWDSSFGMSHKRIVATLNKWDDNDRTDANASLIAAVPRMYKAAYNLLVKLRGIHVDCAEIWELRDALAAASGESEEGESK